MLACARRRVPDGEFRLGELDRLPLPHDSADVIVCALALVHVSRLEPVLAGFSRVLRPGGTWSSGTCTTNSSPGGR